MSKPTDFVTNEQFADFTALLLQKFDDFKNELKNEKQNNAEDLINADASITENAEASLNLNKKIAAIEDTISKDLDSKLNKKLAIKVSVLKSINYLL